MDLLEKLPRFGDYGPDGETVSRGLTGVSLLIFGLFFVISLGWTFRNLGEPGLLFLRWLGVPALSFSLFWVSLSAAHLLHTPEPICRTAAAALTAFAWLACLPAFLVAGGVSFYELAGVVGLLGWTLLLVILIGTTSVVRRYSGPRGPVDK